MFDSQPLTILALYPHPLILHIRLTKVVCLTYQLTNQITYKTRIHLLMDEPGPPFLSEQVTYR
jgi:hypothetical protein